MSDPKPTPYNDETPESFQIADLEIDPAEMQKLREMKQAGIAEQEARKQAEAKQAELAQAQHEASKDDRMDNERRKIRMSSNPNEKIDQEIFTIKNDDKPKKKPGFFARLFGKK